MSKVECFCDDINNCKTKSGLANFRVNFDKIEESGIKYTSPVHTIYYTVWDQDRVWIKND